MALIKSMVSSKTNEWETPQWFFDELNEEFNFTLDPCSNGNHKCKKFYTIKEDGLKQDWSKDVVFMNPPYGGPKYLKLILESVDIQNALVKNAIGVGIKNMVPTREINKIKMPIPTLAQQDKMIKEIEEMDKDIGEHTSEIMKIREAKNKKLNSKDYD